MFPKRKIYRLSDSVNAIRVSSSRTSTPGPQAFRTYWLSADAAFLVSLDWGSLFPKMGATGLLMRQESGPFNNASPSGDIATLGWGYGAIPTPTPHPYVPPWTAYSAAVFKPAVRERARHRLLLDEFQRARDGDDQHLDADLDGNPLSRGTGKGPFDGDELAVLRLPSQTILGRESAASGRAAEFARYREIKKGSGLFSRPPVEPCRCPRPSGGWDLVAPAAAKAAGPR